MTPQAFPRSGPELSAEHWQRVLLDWPAHSDFASTDPDSRSAPWTMPAATCTMALARSGECRRLAPPSHGPYAYRFSPLLRLRAQFVLLRGGHKIQSPAAALPLALARRKPPRPAPMVVLTSFESTLVNPDKDSRSRPPHLHRFSGAAAAPLG